MAQGCLFWTLSISSEIFAHQKSMKVQMKVQISDYIHTTKYGNKYDDFNRI